MTQQPIPFIPTPRDVRRDVVAVGRAAAIACGLDPDVYEAQVRAVPVLDMPVRADSPRPGTTRPERPTFAVTVELEERVVVIKDVTDWHVDHHRLDVYGKPNTAGRDVKIATYAPGHWITIGRTDTAGADA
jgi:hypothetical protein